ncbi:Molybdenum transport protein [Caenispirillum salinarum AK4]|uniref:Molybdenum transport protein n=1 Tax=Caenispirillum salinarum AK4 TaxID=1238182 RepID=K9GXN0_9PROT|nr:cytochrome c [Caenispirillum salinarum]EKV29534.1 Molybdenum transport protein [Caenispirillum salinarum AK4]
MTRLGLLILAILLVAACEQEMNEQPKYEVYETADLFPDGIVNQKPQPGTIALGDLERRAALDERPPLTPALLQRGRERFDIYCAPCHGAAGYGDGMIARRGFPDPPSYHTDRLRARPARYFVQVITQGVGDMYSYATRVEPADRWAIAAYIKALQLSQRVKADRLPPDVKPAAAPASPTDGEDGP